MSCKTGLLLSADILKDCTHRPKAMLEYDVVLIPFDDVNKTSSTIDATNKILLTHLASKSGKTGFKIEGFKSMNKGFFEMSEDDYGSFYTHKFTGMLANATPENREQLRKLVSGERYIAVLEKKWKGENKKGAFIVLGFDNGIVGKVHTYGSDDNNGMEIFELTTIEGEGEEKPALSLVDTDYDTTKTAFDNKFATA